MKRPKTVLLAALLAATLPLSSVSADVHGAIGSPLPSKSSAALTPIRPRLARTASFEHPAKQWNRIARTPMVTLSDGVRSSCAGQQHIPRDRDQVPSSASTISRARFSRRSGTRVRGMGYLQSNMPPPRSLRSAPITMRFPTTYVLYMFSRDSAREGIDDETEIRWLGHGGSMRMQRATCVCPRANSRPARKPGTTNHGFSRGGKARRFSTGDAWSVESPGIRTSRCDGSFYRT